MTTQTTPSADGTSIAFEVHGPAGATPVVYVHGASTQRQMQPAPARLSELTPARVLTYDRRGRGESDGTTPYDVEREIEDIAALIDVLGGRATLLGESSGAVLALEGARHGLPVDGILLYEPPFVVDSQRPPVPADYLERLDALIADGDHVGAHRQFAVEAVGLPPEMADGLPHSPYWHLVEPLTPTLAYDGRIMAGLMAGDPAPLGRYAGVQVPARVVVGEATFPFILSAAEAIARVLPDAELTRIPGADHQLPPELVAPILAELAGGH